MSRVAAPLLLAAATTLGLVLRWPLAQFDVEHYVGPDEGEVVENVLEMMKTGYYHQRHPGYPGLHFYIQMVPASVYVWLERPRTVRDLPRADFYRLARRVTFVAGGLAAWVVYLVGCRALGDGCRLASAVGASALVLSPLVFRVSTVVSPDVMLMLFGAVATGLILRALDTGSRARFLWAGAALGLATAIKYTGALLVVPYGVACALSRANVSRFRLTVFGFVAAALAFCLTSPYTLLDAGTTWEGLRTHVEYYRASESQAALALAHFAFVDGLGVPAMLAFAVGVFGVLTRRERWGWVVLSFPLSYVLLFSVFGRAYPRHAVAILPAVALLAARGIVPLLSRSRPWAAAVAALMLAQPLIDSIRLGISVRKPTPAARSQSWIRENLPRGSRILEDQFTPSFEASPFSVHRLAVEESVFVGNYDFVLHSGYPGGLPLAGLRLVRTFEPEGSLGARIRLYQVPSREALMPVTLAAGAAAGEIVATETAPFGAGWDPEAGGVRLSRGPVSEIFFNVEAPESVSLTLNVGAAVERVSLSVGLGDQIVGTIRIEGQAPQPSTITLPRGVIQSGLNRLVLRYDETFRVSRRLRDGAVRFYSMRLDR